MGQAPCAPAATGAPCGRRCAGGELRRSRYTTAAHPPPRSLCKGWPPRPPGHPAGRGAARPAAGAEGRGLGSAGPDLGHLGDSQREAFAELQRLLAAEPMGPVGVRDRDDKTQRLLRFLRASKYDPQAAARRLRAHSVWWKEYGMDDFTKDDEYDEHGPMFVCGKDRWGQPTLVARPCVHSPTSEADSLETARRCICTLHRCVEQLHGGVQAVNIVYDLWGAAPSNWDPVFCRELITTAAQQFPERMGRVFVINNSWVMSLFWSLVRVMLDPDTQRKVVFCGTNFHKELLGLVKDDHPYLLYAMQVRELPEHLAAKLPLPPREEAAAEAAGAAATAVVNTERGAPHSQGVRTQAMKDLRLRCRQASCFQGMGSSFQPMMQCLPRRGQRLPCGGGAVACH